MRRKAGDSINIPLLKDVLSALTDDDIELPSLDAIAKHLGVTVTTVSRVMAASEHHLAVRYAKRHAPEGGLVWDVEDFGYLVPEFTSCG